MKRTRQFQQASRGPGAGGTVVPEGRCGGCFGCSEREEPTKGNISILKTNGDFVLMSTISLFKFGSLDFTIY